MTDDAVTKREARLRTLTRTLQALRNSGKALVRAEDESSYLQEVCRIIVEDCGHAMVWIGFAENDEDKSIRPVTASGFEEGYLETLGLTWADTGRGHGPTGTAIRTGKFVLCRNILMDSSYAPWREEATRRGYASSIALPLTCNGSTLGALSLYSREPDPFSEDELDLLTDLADDVAIGICSLRLRKANADAEQALRQSEKQFRMLFENACDGIFITDAQGRYVDANVRGLEMLGRARHELLGRSIGDIVTPQEQARLPAALEEVRCGRPHIEEWEFRRGDGSILCGEINGQLLPDGRMIGILRDLTERKRTEEALRASEERYRLLFQNVQEGFYLAEPLYEGETCYDAVYLDVNPAFERIMGLPREQIIGKRAKELVPLIKSEWLEAFGKVARTGEPVSHQAYSETFKKHFEAFVFRPVPGKFAVLVSDITPRKQFEQELTRMNAELERRVSARTEELAKTNRELEAFCYSVSHDLRAPLRSMDGFSQALLEDYGTRLDAEGQDFLRRIRANSQRMARLIDDLLQLSRLTRSQMQLRRVDLSALAQAAIADLRQTDPARDVDVRIAPGLTATGDPVLLRTALTNLLQNAWKFTGQRPDAVIEVGIVDGSQRAEEGRQRTELRSPAPDFRPPFPVFFVRDNGVGFDMRYADKLFTPFQRLHAMTDFPGTGIGLATVQRVLHRHGGRIWVEAAPGLGATFYFTVKESPARRAQGLDFEGTNVDEPDEA